MSLCIVFSEELHLVLVFSKDCFVQEKTIVYLCKLGLVAQVCNINTWEAMEGRSKVEGLLQLQYEFNNGLGKLLRSCLKFKKNNLK